MLKAYGKGHRSGSSIVAGETQEGERIEDKVARVMHNGEAIDEGVEIIYTERKDGVLPAYDIRTDRWEVALDAMDKVTKTKLAERKERQDMKVHKNDEKEQDGINPANSGTSE